MKTTPNSPSDCGHKAELMTYLYGETPLAEIPAFEQHLKECPSCADELQAFGAVRQTLQTWKVEAIPPIEVTVRPSFWQAVRELFRVTPLWGRFALAAAGVLVFLAMFNVTISIGHHGVTLSAGLRPAPRNVDNPINPIAPDRLPTQTVVPVDEKSIRLLVAERVRMHNAEQEARLDERFQELSRHLTNQNRVELAKALAGLKREQRIQLINAIQETEREKPDLLDLFGQVSVNQNGFEK